MKLGMNIRGACACIVVVGLSACGGGGGSTTVDPETPIPGTGPEVPRNTEGLRGGATDLLDTWAPTNPPSYTALATVPTTGSASYAGFLFGEISASGVDDENIIGRLSMEAQFTATSASLTGTATDFVDEDDRPLDGALTIAGGALDRAGNPANDATLRGATVSGTLTGSAAGALDFGLQLEGDFLGVSHAAIGGEAIGRVDTPTGSRDFDGGFIAAQ